MIKQKIITITSTSLLVSGLAISAAFAQDANMPTNIPNHPRVDQVDQRIDNQQNRINSEESSGKITAGQAAQDDRRLQREENQVKKDEAANGGHLTQAEQRKLNREENRNNKDMTRQKRHDRQGKREHHENQQ